MKKKKNFLKACEILKMTWFLKNPELHEVIENVCAIDVHMF
jgi:hypothetical protein